MAPPSRHQPGRADEQPPHAEATALPDGRSLASRLGGLGHVPGLSLDHLEFRVLPFLLGQHPGSAQRDTIAAACTSDTISVDQALDRLRASGLVVWDPADLCMSSNVCRHLVQVQRLAALLSASSLARTTPHPEAKPPQGGPRARDREKAR